jgi:hypothetical protein
VISFSDDFGFNNRIGPETWIFSSFLVGQVYDFQKSQDFDPRNHASKDRVPFVGKG